jgi:predicted acetyltransferase
MPAESLTFREIDPDDTDTLDRWMSTVNMVFTAPFLHTPQRREFRRPVFAKQRLSAAFDRDALVATFRSWDWQLTVPGCGSVTTNAVSSVTVLPTHRRRGALTGLLRADLDAAAARGVTAAVLVASETGIYGRFGFGPATEAASWSLDLGSARVAPGVPRGGSLEIVSAQTLRALAPTIFEAARCPGQPDRSDWWWDVALEITPWPGDQPRALGCLLHRDPDGVPQGFVVYSWKDHWQDRICRSTATVLDLHAATPEAYAALWGYLAELDLIATVIAEDRPVDEPLPWLLSEARAARRSATSDFLWARLLDPVAALSARRYESAGEVVFEVTDPLGYAGGRYALEVGPDGSGRCLPTSADAEVALPVDVLSTVWLGAGDLRAAAIAGRAIEQAPGALARLARLLRTTVAPWTGTWF